MPVRGAGPSRIPHTNEGYHVADKPTTADPARNHAGAASSGSVTSPGPDTTSARHVMAEKMAKATSLLGGDRSQRPALYDPDAIVAIAEQRLGIEGPLDVDRAALEALCAAYEASPLDLTFFGIKRAEVLLVDALIRRERLRQYRARFPDLVETGIPSGSILIVAPFRTGTTFLHHLLAQDPANRTARSWEMYLPVGEDTSLRGDPRYFEDDPRVKETVRFQAGFQRRSRRLAELHPTSATAAEECFGLLETSLRSYSFFLRGVIDPYLEWLDAQPETSWDPVYQTYAEQVAFLQWWQPRPHWVLKSPFHLWHLDKLAHVIPEAPIVQIHRDPAACMKSLCELMSATFGAVAPEPDPAWVGALARRLMKPAMERAMEARRALPKERFLDLDFAEMMNDPIGTARRVYAHAGRTLDTDGEHAMQRWLDDRRLRPTPPGTRPTLATFGLDASTMHADYADYESYAEGSS
jgi:hypothetical protein